MRSSVESIQVVLDELMAHLRPEGATDLCGGAVSERSLGTQHASDASCLIEIEAVVEEVWPSFGLAYAHDAQGRVWGITKSTPSRNASVSTLFKGDVVRLWVTARAGPRLALVDLYERLSLQQLQVRFTSRSMVGG